MLTRSASEYFSNNSFVVAALGRTAQEQFYSPVISETPLGNVVIQRANRGTAAAILIGLLRLSHIRRISTVAIFPLDHYLGNDVAFMRHVDAAISAVSSLPVKIVLLGIPAVRPEHDYGWIEPAEQLTQAGPGVEPIFRIGHFWEKPHPHIAVDFWLRGLPWNSFVIVAEVGALLRLFARITPQRYCSFSVIMPLLYTPFENNGIARLYAGTPSENFSEAISGGLFVKARGAPTGVEFHDLGEPSRLMATWAKIEKQPRYLTEQ